MHQRRPDPLAGAGQRADGIAVERERGPRLILRAVDEIIMRPY